MQACGQRPWVVALALLLLQQLQVCPAMEALQAAALSREIRQHFRQSGMNWVSPKFMKEVRRRALHPCQCTAP